MLATVDAEFAAVYAKRGRPSIPPEFLLRALSVQILYTLRSLRAKESEAKARSPG